MSSYCSFSNFVPKDGIGKDEFEVGLFCPNHQEIVCYLGDVRLPETTSDRCKQQNKAIEAAQLILELWCRKDVGNRCLDLFKL